MINIDDTEKVRNIIVIKDIVHHQRHHPHHANLCDKVFGPLPRSFLFVMCTFPFDRSIRTEEFSPSPFFSQRWKLCSERHYYDQLFLYSFFSLILFFLLFVVYVSPILHTCAHIVSDSLLSFLMSLSVIIVHVVCCGGAIFSSSSSSLCLFSLLVVLHVCECVCVCVLSVFLYFSVDIHTCV